MNNRPPVFFFSPHFQKGNEVVELCLTLCIAIENWFPVQILCRYRTQYIV